MADKQPVPKEKITSMYNGPLEVIKHEADGWFRYSVGKFTDINEAKQTLQSSGIKGYVVAYHNNTRISTREAIEIMAGKIMYLNSINNIIHTQMKKIILSMFILLSSSMIYAQVNIGNILQYGVNDANVLAKPYLSPWGNMLGYSLNSGWYNSAKVHKLLGFDITVTGAYTMSPSSDAYFDINDYSDKLTSFELVDPTNSITPTVAGKSSDRPYLKPQNVPSNPVTDFAMPDGSEIDYLLTPM